MPGVLVQKLKDRIDVQIRGLTSPSLAQDLAQVLSQSIVEEYFGSGLGVESGRTMAALEHVGQIETTPNGFRIGVVGPLSETGVPSDKAPGGTIKAFLKEHYVLKGGVPSNMAWRLLSDVQKQHLARERLAGKFGGEKGGPRYMWTHERGAPSAGIEGRGYIDKGLEKWRTQVSSIIERHRGK